MPKALESPKAIIIKLVCVMSLHAGAVQRLTRRESPGSFCLHGRPYFARWRQDIA